VNFLYLADIFLPVTDLERSKNWYMKHFGLTMELTAASPTTPTTTFTTLDTRSIKLSFSKNSFTLVQMERISCYSHIPFNFHTNQIKQLHDSLKEKGVTVTKLTSDDGVLCCDFYDPDGNRIGLCQESTDDDSIYNIEVGGTFLTVRNLDTAVDWYKEKMGYDFDYFNATEAAGYIGPSPEYIPGLTIHYAGVKSGLTSPWSRICLVEPPEFHPLVHVPYTIQSAHAEEDYTILKSKGVRLSEFHEQGFHYYDYDGNPIGIKNGGSI
jgi:catechol 2,3-dioxygenase-like lactoylglutathione lyase family enzyme